MHKRSGLVVALLTDQPVASGAEGEGQGGLGRVGGHQAGDRRPRAPHRKATAHAWEGLGTGWVGVSVTYVEQVICALEDKVARSVCVVVLVRHTCPAPRCCACRRMHRQGSSLALTTASRYLQQLSPLHRGPWTTRNRQQLAWCWLGGAWCNKLIHCAAPWCRRWRP